jgi:hypothetical protein
MLLMDCDGEDPERELTILEAAERVLSCEDVPDDQQPVDQQPKSALPTLKKMSRRVLSWFLAPEGNV